MKLTSRRSKIAAAIAIILFIWSGKIVWDFFDTTSVPHQTIQLQLKLFGEAMYEFHSTTGRWPAKLDDLQRTSLPARSYVWRQTAETFTLLWPQDLKPDPKDNANVLLAYESGSLMSRLGRIWVCWGDLRSELLRKPDLQAKLPERQ